MVLDMAPKIVSFKIPIIIWSDSQKVLRAITLPFVSQKNWFVQRQIYEKIEEL